tara:strand:+ start:2063 stop:2716 length:654 start_codon:yes stop_codon:yes gene_type:complete
MEFDSICYYKDIYYPENNSNCHVIKSLLANRIWEKKINTMMLKYIKPSWVCLDIGANIGLHSLTMAKLGKVVHSFEAQPIIAECLQSTIVKKEINNIILYKYALGAVQRESAIFTDNSGRSSIEGVRDHLFSHRIPTYMRRLDDLHIPKVDFMKIDIEGYEWHMLQGAEETIKKHRPLLILETFKTKKNMNELEIFCEKFSYSKQYISSGNWLLTPY